MKEGTYQYYAGNMVYDNVKSLKYLLFDEGLVNKSSGAYAYEYHMKVHPPKVGQALGNTRVTFQPEVSGTTTTQVAEYYPFGSSFLPVSPAGTNKYLYNGKLKRSGNPDPSGEKQDDVLGGTALDWYDYGARFYDPVGKLGWLSVDPMAEVSRSWNPYTYGKDNPIRFIDPDGMFDEDKVKKLKPKEGQLVARKDATATQKPNLKPTSKPASTPKPINTQANAGTIRSLPSAYEKAWMATTSPDMQQYIKIDPVVKAVATGTAAMGVAVLAAKAAPAIVGNVARSALTIVNMAQGAAIAVETNTATAVTTGLVVGTAGTFANLPHDAVTLPGQVADLTQMLTSAIITIVTQSTQQQGNTKEDEKDKK